jgi:hypothetical protein
MKPAKIILIALIFSLSYCSPAVAQEWDKTFGGDTANSVQQTTDGGYIIAGESAFGWYYYWTYDVVLIKTDSNGNKLWGKTFDDGEGKSVQQTTDGGYIIAGTTVFYGAGGGDYDVLLIKTDSDGNKQWDKTFSGEQGAFGYSVQQTTDGGYIIAGSGGNYVLLLKTDSNGNRQWHKTFGSPSMIASGNSVQQTTDGGYIIAGYIGSYEAGSRDVWLIKTDSNGNKQWDKTFQIGEWDKGNSVHQTTDGGYIIAGTTDPYYLNPFDDDTDVWLIKTDSNGNKQWDKTFGGTEQDYGSSVQQTTDGGYIITGDTLSYGAGYFDIWLIKTDSSGNKQWDKTFGGNYTERGNSVQQTTDGGYIIGGQTTSYGPGNIWLVKVTECARPAVPADISYPAGDTNGVYIVNWPEVEGATSYQVGRSSDGGQTWAQAYNGPNMSFIETVCPEPGTGNYRYRVKAKNHCGDSGWQYGDGHDCIVSVCDNSLEIYLQSPENFSAFYSPPTFTWTAMGGGNNRFAVDLTLDEGYFNWYWSTYEDAGQPVQGGSWTMPQQVWNAVPSAGWVWWRVRGADIDQDPLDIVTSEEVRWFYKP